MSNTLSVVVVVLLGLLQASIILVVGAPSTCLPCSPASPPAEPKPAWNGSIEVNVELDGRHADFTWNVTSEIPDGLNIYVRHEKNYTLCEDHSCVCEWEIKKLSDNVELYLDYGVNAKVTVKVGEVKGSNNITAPATIPWRRVENLTCSNWSCEAIVERDCSYNNGQNFHVQFQLEAMNGYLRRYSLAKTVDGNISQNFTARILLKDLDLLPLTNYRLTAYTANSEGRFKDPQSPKEYFTTPNAPMNVTLVMRQVDEKNQMLLSWKLSSPSLVKQEVHYTVSLCQAECVDKNFTNNNTVIIPLDELNEGQAYIAKVQACITGLQCSKAQLEMWTPLKPDIQENEANVSETTEKTTATTITVTLPVLCNPPGWHWVAVKKTEDSESNQSEAWYESLKAEALRALRQAKDAMRNGSSLSFDENSPTDGEFHIMKSIQQNETDEETKQVTIGENFPLEKNTNYTVVIVTEKRRGDVSQYHVTQPVIHLTQPDVEPVSAMLMIIGICISAVLLGAVVAVLWVKPWNRSSGRRPGAMLMRQVQS